MHFTPQLIVPLLLLKGVRRIYHANTVTTSLSFINEQALLSRAKVEEMKLLQTVQYSDSDDVKYGIYDSVFLDTVDIHQRLNSFNNYGPVLFSFPTRFLLRAKGCLVGITKSNPTKWAELEEDQRWFQDKESLMRDFTIGDFDQMIVIASPDHQLYFKDSGVTLTLDDPNQKNYYEQAISAINAASKQRDSCVPSPIKRECNDICGCKIKYSNNDKLCWKFFAPRVGG